MTKRIKVILAGALLAVTAFALGLLAVSFTGTASASPSNSLAQATQADPASFLAASTTTTNTNRFKGGPGFGPGMRGGAMSTGDEILGPITKIDSNIITVGKRTVTLNDQTVIGDAAGTLTKSDLKVDDFVVALGKAETDGSLTARWVLKQDALPAKPPAPAPGKGDFIGGGVKSVDAANNSFVITATVTKGQAATDVTIVVSSTTQFKGQNIKSLSDLKAGDKVVVVGTKQADGSYTATIVADGKFPGPGGPGGHGPRGGPGRPGKPGGSVDPTAPNGDSQGTIFSSPLDNNSDSNFYPQG